MNAPRLHQLHVLYTTIHDKCFERSFSVANFSVYTKVGFQENDPDTQGNAAHQMPFGKAYFKPT